MTPQKEPALALAYWLSQNEPKLFEVIQAHALRAANKGLGDISDWLSNIGGSISDAVTSVGDFLTSQNGLQTLTGVAGTILTTQAQQNVLQTQMTLAQAQRPPAPIANVVNPSTGLTQAIYTPTNTPVTPQLLTQLTPSFLARWGLPLAAGVGILALVLLLRR